MLDIFRAGKFYWDDGTEINPLAVPKPGLCILCRWDDNPYEWVKCILTRADQMDEDEFTCHSFVKK